MSAAERAEELLKLALGPQAQFRPGQLDAILGLVEDRARMLIVQRTGWGKSVVYFIATKLLRDEGAGPTILITPLKALMRDQVRMAETLGLHARHIDSDNQSQWNEIEEELRAGEVDILLVSPERLANQRFRERTLPAISGRIGLFVVDEAHCISDWGHDFRPDYRRIRRLTQALPEGVPVLATTATANNRVIDDIKSQLGSDLAIVRGTLGRDSLYLQVNRLEAQAKRLGWLAEYLEQQDGSGVIYVLTRRDTCRVAEWLQSQGVDAFAYSNDTPAEERPALEEALRDNRIKALVATVALGMGFDKPDLRFVIHYQRPSSIIAYYQQIGRAGRAVDRAEVILLAGHEDDEIGDYFIEKAFPPEEVLSDVLAAVDELDGARMMDLMREVNAKKSTMEQALKILQVEGAIARDGTTYTRTANPWNADSPRVARVTEARRVEQQRMREYVETADCLMQFLTRELDDPGEPCGRCANCAGPFALVEPDPALVQEAVRFLKRSYRPIVPRKQWPNGLEGVASHRIAEEHQLREGRALAVYGDTGWGELVKWGKYGGHGFADELVEAAAEMIENDLKPDPEPTWVTAIPSRRNPELVQSFARRLADRLGLPFSQALEKIRDTPQQKDMENSVQQARNARRGFAAVPENMLDGSVLLVDDMVDSRWSLTICGIALAEAGSGPVFPIALGETSGGADDS